MYPLSRNCKKKKIIKTPKKCWENLEKGVITAHGSRRTYPAQEVRGNT